MQPQLSQARSTPVLGLAEWQGEGRVMDSAVGQERCVKWGWREWGLQCAAAVCVCVLGWGWVAGSESQWKMAYVEGASFDT